MNPAKLDSIENWPTPKFTKDIFRFIGFINFYRRFIDKFGSIVMPLTDLMKKDDCFTWGPNQELAFKAIKNNFQENVILKHFDWDQPARLETDASDRGTGGVYRKIMSNGERKRNITFYWNRGVVMTFDRDELI